MKSTEYQKLYEEKRELIREACPNANILFIGPDPLVHQDTELGAVTEVSGVNLPCSNISEAEREEALCFQIEPAAEDSLTFSSSSEEDGHGPPPCKRSMLKDLH